MHGRCGKEMGHIGTIAHELGHFLGLPDLYGGNANPGNGIGNCGMMGNSWGWDSTQLYPPIMCPWSKIEMGWLQTDLVDKSGRYVFPPSGVNPKVFKIQMGFPQGEYLLVENRQPIGLDGKMPHGGIVIWHIDELAMHNVDGGYPGRGTWPKDGKHYRVSVLQADGSYSLEQGKVRGSKGHIYTPGDWLPEDKSKFPSTASYQGGVLKATGMRIFDIKEIDGDGGDTYVQFSILFAGEKLPPTAAPTAFPTLQEVQYKTVSRDLISTYAGGTGSYGNMFDVKAVNDVTITHMAIHSKLGPSDPPMDIEVYTKTGTFVGSEYAAKEWNKICCSQPIRGAGLAKRTELPKSSFSDSVTVAEGEVQAFYVTSKGADLRYTKATGMVGDIMNGNLNLQILSGNGIGYYPFGGHVEARVWNGIIYYDAEVPVTTDADLGDGGESAGPSPVPTEPVQSPTAPVSTPTAPAKLPTLPTPTPLPPTPPAVDSSNLDLGPTTSIKSSSFSGNSGSYGLHFDLIVFKPMAIRSLEFHTDLTEATRVLVWSRKGTYVGYERDASAWKQLCTLWLWVKDT